MKTVNVTVTIQMDIPKGSDEKTAVGEVLDKMNQVVNRSDWDLLNQSQPQIMGNNFDVTEQPSNDEEE